MLVLPGMHLAEEDGPRRLARAFSLELLIVLLASSGTFVDTPSRWSPLPCLARTARGLINHACEDVWMEGARKVRVALRYQLAEISSRVEPIRYIFTLKPEAQPFNDDHTADEDEKNPHNV